jgi:hypothetical protein
MLGKRRDLFEPGPGTRGKAGNEHQRLTLSVNFVVEIDVTKSQLWHLLESMT